MVKMKHSLLIFLAGFLWLAIGIFLLTLGIRFILNELHSLSISTRFSILSFFKNFARNKEQAAILVLTTALILGYFKGRFALAKSVERQVKRIRHLPEPASIKHIYSKGYYFLILGMIGLGMVIKFSPISLDTRGFIDTAIGAALINGALLYFRAALTSKQYRSL